MRLARELHLVGMGYVAEGTRRMATAAIAKGAVAGLLATVPMTLSMELMHRQLPAREQYPLPPSEIMTVAEEASLRGHLDPPKHTAATLAAHFGYGATAGALYGPLAAPLPLPPALKGSIFGMLLWSGSYLGLLPALGILKPATEHPARRNALMIAAHLVWGAALGALFERMAEAPLQTVSERYGC
jgi:putative membrane protein